MNQLAANALASAASYLLVGIGFSLIYTAGRFFNFAHGAIITIGAYATYVSVTLLSLPIGLSVLSGILTSAVVGGAIEWGVYRRLRRKNTGAAILLLVSLGVYVSLHSTISLIFGAGALSLRSGAISEGWLILGARLTGAQVCIMGAGVAGCIATWLYLQKTLMGKLIRAVGCDPELAFAYGFNQNWIIMNAVVLGSALAGVAGILLAYDSNLTPFMGFQILLGGVVAVIIGGVGNIFGIALGATLLGFAQHSVAWWISSAWQDVLVFGILILFLVVRPQGFLGTAPKRGAV